MLGWVGQCTARLHNKWEGEDNTTSEDKMKNTGKKSGQEKEREREKIKGEREREREREREGGHA